MKSGSGYIIRLSVSFATVSESERRKMKFVIFTILFAGASFALPQLLGNVVGDVGSTVGGLLGADNGSLLGGILGVGKDNQGLFGL